MLRRKFGWSCVLFAGAVLVYVPAEVIIVTASARSRASSPIVLRIDQADVAVIGAGAAGLMCSVWAGRTARASGRERSVVALDGARKIGAKILVAGGGRCNVTHHRVLPKDYNGSSANAIKKVLARFGVKDTVSFFGELGVELKQEDTGKLFPTTDDAHTVLGALLTALESSGSRLIHPARVASVDRDGDGFVVRGDWGAMRTSRVVLATGGMALPRTGSDGVGYGFARGLGHSVSGPVAPALVPLVVAGDHFVKELSGIAAPACVRVCAGSGKRLYETTAPVLCTHFGLSGPAILDASRHLTEALRHDPETRFELDWLPGMDPGSIDAQLTGLGKRSVGRFVRDVLPERLALALCAHARVDPATTGAALKKDDRRALVRAMTALAVPIERDRGFTHAEVTMGGVPLTEVDLKTMESRVCPGLHLIGEILDVDGRIGGFNFQWAWASGFIAGRACVEALG